MSKTEREGGREREREREGETETETETERIMKVENIRGGRQMAFTVISILLCLFFC